MDFNELANNSKFWVWKEALKLKQKFEKNPPKKGYILFETGYGPSGLPHIGTFGEVFRTTMVRKAFEKISDIPTKLIAFSDDMDGLRKVPENLPNKKMIEANLGKPLTEIPDPFGSAESFGSHMNGRLKKFLDKFEFDYEFKSSTDCYKSGLFDEKMLGVLKNYQAIMDIMLPTLGEERQKTYSPFLPICPETGIVLQVPLIEMDVEAGKASFKRDNGEIFETEVTSGNCKLQWKPDWGMRWAALGVDYEMHGKDLTPSAAVSSRICKVIGGKAPINFVYEMFLDEKGEKISKSKGNGISLDEWLNYGTEESIALFMINNPQKAKKLHFYVIPQHIDDYIKFCENAVKAEEDQKIVDNPAWHINYGKVKSLNLPVDFAMLVNLASACNPENKDILWGFISKYEANANAEKMPYLDKLAELAVKYYYNFIKPSKHYHVVNEAERKAILELKAEIENIDVESSKSEDIQTMVFTIGKNNGYETNLRDWFSLLYAVLLGQSFGPRLGSFIKLFGKQEFLKLIDEKTS